MATVLTSWSSMPSGLEGAAELAEGGDDARGAAGLRDDRRQREVVGDLASAHQGVRAAAAAAAAVSSGVSVATSAGAGP